MDQPTTPPRLEVPTDCTCFARWQCSACTLALLDAGRHDEAARTEISRSIAAVLRWSR